MTELPSKFKLPVYYYKTADQSLSYISFSQRIALWSYIHSYFIEMWMIVFINNSNRYFFFLYINLMPQIPIKKGNLDRKHSLKVQFWKNLNSFCYRSIIVYVIQTAFKSELFIFSTFNDVFGTEIHRQLLFNVCKFTK